MTGYVTSTSVSKCYAKNTCQALIDQRRYYAMHDNMYDLWGEYTIGGIKDFLIYIFVKLT